MKWSQALGLTVVAVAAFWVGRSSAEDPNAKPTYGVTGLPKNCRAIVQVNVDAFRAKTYSTEEIIGSLERNCGALGHSWGQ
jgi:hypothetical protein